MISALDRTKAPALVPVEKLRLQEPTSFTLSNGIPVYVLSGLSQEAVKVEFVFNAGKWYQDIPAQAALAARMLREGSKKYPSKDFAELLDQKGASIKAIGQNDVATVTLFSLVKHLPAVLPLLEDVMKRPAYDAADLDAILTNKVQHLLVNLEKNEFLADRAYQRHLYGAEHPYGYKLMPEQYKAITPELLHQFHKKYYHAKNCMIIVSGNVQPGMDKLLDQHFGGDDWAQAGPPFDKAILPHLGETKLWQKEEGSLQSSIRIGKPLFNKTHPDHQALSVLNTIFGGYFGSRLMSNIREDKGYTYGIYSSLNSMRHGGDIQISTDVGADVCEAAVKEIYFEMQRLREELVPEDELTMVRNYLTGRIQSSVDGPFKLAGMLKGLFIYDLKIDYIYQFIDVINSVSAKELQELANKYYGTDDIHEIIVG